MGEQGATGATGGAVFPYSVYVALLSQTGTAAPSVVVLQNTIGAIVWTRAGTGQYFGTLTGAFTANKTAVFIVQSNTNGGASSFSRYGINRQSANALLVDTNFVLETSPGAGANISLSDDLLNTTTVEVRVYP